MNQTAAMQQFIREQQRKGYTRQTILYKTQDLIAYVLYLDTAHSMACVQATRQHVADFLEHCFTQDNSPVQYNRRLLCLKQFYEFLLREGKVLLNPVLCLERKKYMEKESPWFSEEEVQKIFRIIPATYKGRRNRAILELIYSSGIRLNEVYNLDIEDIDLESREVFIYHGKGYKERVVPVGAEALRQIESYLRLRLREKNVQDPYALFLGRSKERITKSGIERMFERYKKRAGITTRGNVHTLRHACATHLLRHGAPLVMVARLLGHDDLTSTYLYTHITKEDLRGEHQKSFLRIREDVHAETGL